ncbi:MAG TPA: nuclear transport factor 2 family protein [Microvirga sp.]|jgi:2-C-methyl-D-erythritol 4-phosphate cytidylyltransferase|nr:nuclear transport factor 2 family protein [Microvirga sp.]
MNAKTLRIAIAAIAVAMATPSAAQTPAQVRAMTVEQKLQHLLDREEIGEAIVAYGHSFDRRDWALHRSLFADRIEMDFSASIGAGLTTMAADDWVKGVRPFFESLPATQHIAYPLSVEIKGDEAYVVSLLHAQHFLPNKQGAPIQKMVGRYENWLIRTPQGWRFRKMVQHIDWNEGNWWIFDKAAGKAK